MTWLRRFWTGETPLPVAFWLYGVVAIGALTLVGPFILFPLVAMGGRGAQVVGFAVGSLIIAYQVFAACGIWRSAGRQAGRNAWKLLARLAVVLFLGWLAVGLWATYRMLGDESHDRTRTSADVAATLERDPAYPFTGFWKGECNEGFGLAIEPSVVAGKYSLSFCGPGGCFKPGSYRPDTPIRGDEAYRIIDEDTIEVSGRGGFARYVRCE